MPWLFHSTTRNFPNFSALFHLSLPNIFTCNLKGQPQFLSREPTITVSVPFLRQAFAWLLSHNWHWLWSTKDDLVDVPAGKYGTRLNSLLAEYAKELDGKETGVPQCILEAAIPLADADAAQAARGPAEAASEEQSLDLASAALIRSSSSTSLALQQVQRIMKERKEIMLLDAQAARSENQEEKLTCVQLELTSLDTVRCALEKLTSSTLRQELAQELLEHEKDDQQPLVHAKIQCGSNYLKCYAPDFWAKQFVEAFPRGDCLEEAGSVRVHARYGVDWSDLLLKQTDKPWFRSHKERIASSFLYFVHRDQIRKCESRI